MMIKIQIYIYVYNVCIYMCVYVCVCNATMMAAVGTIFIYSNVSRK